MTELTAREKKEKYPTKKEKNFEQAMAQLEKKEKNEI